MQCKEGFENVRGDLCLQNDASSNEYVSQLVSLLLDIDNGIDWQRNFKDYGAAHGTHITVEEIYAILGAEDDQSRAKALAAVE